ncbi:hypothetical protein [Streptomyces sp. NPDC058739]|uniref:hypothetical protein n=1 Tax=Streptomyces sp. NPDC058739 TaxID=3346618 RepID=UPI0036938142
MTEVTGRTGGTVAPLLARDECDRLERRLRHAVAEFVDEPRHAVEEADRAVEEIATRFTEAVARRRRGLRMAWERSDAPRGQADDTELLRLALRDYRELALLLLHDGAESHGDVGRRRHVSPGAPTAEDIGGRDEAPPPASDAERGASAKSGDDSPIVAPTPPAG